MYNEAILYFNNGELQLLRLAPYRVNEYNIEDNYL